MYADPEHRKWYSDPEPVEVCHICGDDDPQYGCDACGEPTCECCGGHAGQHDLWACNNCTSESRAT